MVWNWRETAKTTSLFRSWTFHHQGRSKGHHLMGTHWCRNVWKIWSGSEIGFPNFWEYWSPASSNELNWPLIVKILVAVDFNLSTFESCSVCIEVTDHFVLRIDFISPRVHKHVKMSNVTLFIERFLINSAVDRKIPSRGHIHSYTNIDPTYIPTSDRSGFGFEKVFTLV